MQARSKHEAASVVFSASSIRFVCRVVRFEAVGGIAVCFVAFVVGFRTSASMTSAVVAAARQQ